MRLTGRNSGNASLCVSRTADEGILGEGTPIKPLPEDRRRKMPVRAIFAVVVFLVGLACVAYPFASDYLNRVEQAKVADKQEELVASASTDTLQTERDRAVRYNDDLRNGMSVVTDPFDPNAVRPNQADYLAAMNVAGDGVMGTIVIPGINVRMPMYHGTEGEGMAHGVGHVENTSLPIGGASTHCVLAGHTGLPSATIFDKLDQMKVGDYFVLEVLGEDHAYRVYDIEVVLPEQTSSLVVQQGRDLVTLVTCTPYGVNSHRLLVHAERCEVPSEYYELGEQDVVPVLSTVQDNPTLVFFTLAGAAIAVCILLACGLVAWLLRRAMRGKHAAGGQARQNVLPDEEKEVQRHDG